ncbi:MarR family winged helix-turn-helix transcriptional regulator [Streptomyces albus]|uniref:MarR family winged helix-turn-helix transcriptional regulator n=1 Tax=Streptomyces albus TaxID=1888 RepID=UPI000AC12252|nr:MarR family transcriptional regulator [Streptomyces albus]
MSDLYQLGRRLAEIALDGMGADAPDLAPGEFLVLQDLFLHGRSSVGDIAKRTGLAQSRVSTSVRSLVGRNWVITAADPADKRKTLVDVTEPIRAAGQQRRAGRADKTLTDALTEADDSERAALITALERLHQLLVAGRTHRRFPDTVKR